MILQYFNKNKNKYKALIIYSKVINEVKILNSKENVFKSNFTTSFEITTVLLFAIFYASKQRFANKNVLSQQLMDLFILDIDHSFREIGIGDMSIGKYVKGYVKKFYYRISILELIFQNDKKDDFKKYIKNKEILNNINNLTNISDILFKGAKKLIKFTLNNQLNGKIELNLFN